MAQRNRTQRRLILDRLERNINCHKESIRRLQEISGLYAKGEEERPGSYILLMEQVDVLLQAELNFLTLYDTFLEFARV